VPRGAARTAGRWCSSQCHRPAARRGRSARRSGRDAADRCRLIAVSEELADSGRSSAERKRALYHVNNVTGGVAGSQETGGRAADTCSIDHRLFKLALKRGGELLDGPRYSYQRLTGYHCSLCRC
jgi:hypothetical protein